MIMYRDRDPKGGRTITCGVCDMTSYSPGDIEHGYCGKCHKYADEVVEGLPPTQDLNRLPGRALAVLDDS